MKRQTLLEQVRRNAVALISLVIAITSLGYNTWRNEHSEDNRNRRWAAFEILLKLGELQDLSFVNFYDCDRTANGSVRSGWTILNTIEDLTVLLKSDMPESTAGLRETWQAQSGKFDFATVADCRNGVGAEVVPGGRKEIEKSVQRVYAAIEVVRADALQVLASLD